MKSKKKIRIIIILSIIVILLVILIIYFSQMKWYNRYGWEGHYSSDTYLVGGVGSNEYSKNTRLHYSYVIESGGMHLELKDVDGNIVYEVDVTETGDGYIAFDYDTPVTYYEQEYALTDDTVAYSDCYLQVKRSNFRMFLRELNIMTNYKLFGPDFE